MIVPPLTSRPQRSSYDVVIVGGAIMGSSVAWFLCAESGFDGTVLVVERDPTYEFTSTARTNSCMRQQYFNELNVRISQFSAGYVRNFRREMGGDPEVPDLAVHHFGYMFLADDEGFAERLRAAQQVQASLGAGTVIMSPDEIAAEYPFYNVDDIVCGSHNVIDEGWFDSATMFDWWRRKARCAGVEYLTGEVVAIKRSGSTGGSGRSGGIERSDRSGRSEDSRSGGSDGRLTDGHPGERLTDGHSGVQTTGGHGGERLTDGHSGVHLTGGHRGGRVTGVTLASGETVSCGTLVNAAGPRAAVVARMAGLDLPVEARKRYTVAFDAAEPLERALPLTIDPTGVHVRSDGGAYVAGSTPEFDPAVPFDDFRMDGAVWEEQIWPVLAHRIPAFDRARLRQQWAGHYAHNTLDHNAVIGPHTEVANFIFVNGFSGHGVQQSPAMGRGVAELIAHGEYRSLDLRPLGYDRIARREPFPETAVI